MNHSQKRAPLSGVVSKAPQGPFTTVSEDLFRIAAELASDLIYEWNTADDRLEWFGNVDRILGFEQGEFPRTIEAWVSRIHPDDRKRMEDDVEHHRKDTTPIYEEYRIQREDGTWRHWVDRGVPVLDDGGRPCKWIGVCTDVTERRRSEDSLRESEKRFRELPNSYPRPFTKWIRPETSPL
jgi:PAS domain S-box-containing protein